MTSRHLKKPFAAKAALYGGADSLTWWDPTKLIGRAQAWFDRGPHESVASANVTRLRWLAAVRHRIGHGTTRVRLQLDSATMGLAGRRYRGSSAGRFSVTGSHGRIRPKDGSSHSEGAG